MITKLIKLSAHLKKSNLKKEAFDVVSLIKKARLNPPMSPIERGDGKMCIDWYANDFDPYDFVDQIIDEYKVIIDNSSPSDAQWLAFLKEAGVNVASWMNAPLWAGFAASLDVADPNMGTQTRRTAGGGLGEAKAVNLIPALAHLGFDKWIFDIQSSCTSVDALASLVAHEMAHVVLGHTMDWLKPRFDHWIAGMEENQRITGSTGVSITLGGEEVDVRDIDRLTLDTQTHENDADLLGKVFAETAGYTWTFDIELDWVDATGQEAAYLKGAKRLLEARREVTARAKAGSAYPDPNDAGCVSKIQFLLNIPQDGVFGPGTLAKWREKVNWSSSVVYDVLIGLLPKTCLKAQEMISRDVMSSHPLDHQRGNARRLLDIEDPAARVMAINVTSTIEEKKLREELEYLQNINDQIVASEAGILTDLEEMGAISDGEKLMQDLQELRRKSAEVSARIEAIGLEVEGLGRSVEG